MDGHGTADPADTVLKIKIPTVKIRAFLNRKFLMYSQVRTSNAIGNDLINMGFVEVSINAHWHRKNIVSLTTAVCL